MEKAFSVHFLLYPLVVVWIANISDGFVQSKASIFYSHIDHVSFQYPCKIGGGSHAAFFLSLLNGVD